MDKEEYNKRIKKEQYYCDICGTTEPPVIDKWSHFPYCPNWKQHD